MKLLTDQRQTQKDKTGSRFTPMQRSEVLAFRKHLETYDELTRRLKHMGLSTGKTRALYNNIIINSLNGVDMPIPKSINGWFLNKYKVHSEIPMSLHKLCSKTVAICRKHRNKKLLRNMMFAMCAGRMSKTFQKRILLCQTLD